MASSNLKLYACDFEVFGKVQGVFFRKYTQKQANQLGLRGWCMNTSLGTVKGYAEGNEQKLLQMQQWLKTTGSPRSIIEKAEFSPLKSLHDYTEKSFIIKT